MIKIRKAELKDLDKIYDIETKVWTIYGVKKETLEKRIETFPEGFLVIEKKGKIIGYINSMRVKNNTHIETVEQIKRIIDYYDPGSEEVYGITISILPEERNKEYATQLINEWLKRIKQLGIKKVSGSARKRLVEYYKRFGFRKIKDLPKFWGNEDYVSMEKELK